MIGEPDWQRVTLKDVCSSVQYGFTASASAAAEGPKFLRITDIASTSLSWNDVPHCSISAFDEAKYLLQDGDIVVARTGATVGYAKFIKTPPRAIFASYLVRFKPRAGVDPRFLGAIVQSISYKNWVKSHAGGSAQPNANARTLGDFPLLLPPLVVQRRIVSILSAYDDLIEVNRRRVAILEEMARRLFEEWFVHFRFPGHENVPVHDTPDGPLPGRWVFGTLGDFAATRNVTIRPGDKPEEMLCHYSYPAFDRTGLPEIERAATILSNKTLLAPPVLLIGKLNPKKPKIWPVIAPTEYRQVASTEFVPLAPQGGAGLAVLTGYASSSALLARLRSFASGTSTSHQRVRPDDILAAAIAIPPPELLSSAEQQLNPLQRSIGSFRQINARLTVARDLLLPRLVSGELSVADAPARLLEAAD